MLIWNNSLSINVTFIFFFRLHAQENDEISQENSPSKSVLDTLREMSRKRIHSQLELSGNYDEDLNEESAKRECIREDIVPEENITSM